MFLECSFVLRRCLGASAENGVATQVILGLMGTGPSAQQPPNVNVPSFLYRGILVAPYCMLPQDNLRGFWASQYEEILCDTASPSMSA